MFLFTTNDMKFFIYLLQAIAYGMVLMDGNVVNINKLRKLNLQRIDKIFKVMNACRHTYTHMCTHTHARARDNAHTRARTHTHTNTYTVHLYRYYIVIITVVTTSSTIVWRCSDQSSNAGQDTPSS